MGVVGAPVSSLDGLSASNSFLRHPTSQMSEVFAGRASQVLAKEDGAGPGGLVERE